MIKQDELYEITIVPKNIEHYSQFFEKLKYGNKIQVTGEQLAITSRKKIKYICGFCGCTFERQKGSQNRININTTFTACKNCRSKKIKTTCIEKYGVDHPMKVPEIHQKSVEHHINNFGHEFNTCAIINGVPTSQVQKKLFENLENFQLNYYENGFYYDLFNLDKNLVIEYNGKGHDLSIKCGKITEKEFKEKEQKKQSKILETHNLLIIQDSKDKMLHKKNYDHWIEIVRQTILENNHYKIIRIE